jgi:hypothetical protein
MKSPTKQDKERRDCAAGVSVQSEREKKKPNRWGSGDAALAFAFAFAHWPFSPPQITEWDELTSRVFSRPR